MLWTILPGVSRLARSVIAMLLLLLVVVVVVVVVLLVWSVRGDCIAVTPAAGSQAAPPAQPN